MGNGAMGLLARWGLVLLILLAPLARAQQEPPARVGRLAAVDGEVWLYDTESREWVAAARNRPLTQGERLAVSAGGSAELQVGASALRLDGDTEIEAVRLDDERLQFALTRGSVALQVQAAELAADLEVFTPEARFLPLRAGLYRIDRRADTSSGTTWRGLLRATTRELVLTVEPGRRLELGPDAGAAAARWSPPVQDAFAAAFLREAEIAAAAPEFVSPEMTGVAELARYGSWQQHPEFGWAWSPSVVAPQWAPYRYGQWVWMQPWGWTWVDAAPWGFAPFHYGRWFWWGNRWSWAPGPVHARPVYAPAVVGWVGGPPPAVGRRPPPPTGWVPLAPREVYRPGYAVSPGQMRRLNPHAPPGPLPPPAMVNRGVPGAVTAWPAPGLVPRPPAGAAAPRDDEWPHRPWRGDAAHPQSPSRPPPPRRETFVPRAAVPVEAATAPPVPQPTPAPPQPAPALLHPTPAPRVPQTAPAAPAVQGPQAAQAPFGGRPPRPTAPLTTGREPAAAPTMPVHPGTAPATAAPAQPFRPAPVAAAPQAAPAAAPAPPPAARRTGDGAEGRPGAEPGERRRPPDWRPPGRER